MCEVSIDKSVSSRVASALSLVLVDSDTSVEVQSQPAFTASGLPSGQLYYFAVTAYDAAGNESSFSPEASKLVQ